MMRELAGKDPNAVTAEIVAAAARKRDFLAQNLIGETVTYLGMGIANIVSILNPEIVVLGGGLFQAADLLLEPVRREFRRWAQPRRPGRSASRSRRWARTPGSWAAAGWPGTASGSREDEEGGMTCRLLNT